MNRRAFWKFFAAAPVAAVSTIVAGDHSGQVTGKIIEGGLTLQGNGITVKDCTFYTRPADVAVKVSG
jgi:hypothetical protein